MANVRNLIEDKTGFTVSMSKVSINELIKLYEAKNELEFNFDTKTVEVLQK